MSTIGSVGSHSCVLNKPTKIEYQKLKILILDAPNNSNVKLYLNEMLDFGVTSLVRTCEASYNEAVILEQNILIKDLVFNDGDPPPSNVVSEWLSLIREVIAKDGAVAVHCVAGLGRAPVLACIALVEYGMQPLDAISYVRERRKGAINRKQLEFLKTYRRRRSNGCVQFCRLM